MPLFNDINLYYGSSSLTSPLPSSSYYSPFGLPPRIGYSGGLMPKSRLLPSRAGYSPLLPTISETSCLSSLPRRPLTPLSRISSPRIITSSYLPPKPIRIDTADIDVSSPRTPRVERERARAQDDQEFSRVGTIKRGRTVVRLHTKKPKDNPSLQRRKQTPGERLMEKFLIKDKIAEVAKEERQRKLEEQERLERLKAEESVSTENPSVPIPVPQIPAEELSPTLLTENAALDILVSTQEEEDSHVTEVPRTDDKKDNRSRSVRPGRGKTGKKTKKRDLNRQVSEPTETLWMMEEESSTDLSPLQRRNTVKKLRRNSQDLESMSCPSSRRSSLDIDTPVTVPEEEELKTNKKITVKRKRTDKPKIVADVSVENSISEVPVLKSPVKFVVDDIQVEETPASPRTIAKKFRYEVTIQEVEDGQGKPAGKENRASGDKKIKKKVKGAPTKQQTPKTTAKPSNEKVKTSQLKSEKSQEESNKDCKPNTTSKSFQNLHKIVDDSQTSVAQKTIAQVDNKELALLKGGHSDDKTVADNRKAVVTSKHKDSKLDANIERDEGYVSKRRRSDPKIAKIKEKEVQSGVFVAEKKKSPIMMKIIPKMEDIKAGKRVVERRPEEKKKGPKRQGDPMISPESDGTPLPQESGVNFWAFLNSLDDEYKPVTLQKALSLDIVSASDIIQGKEQSSSPVNAPREALKIEEPATATKPSEVKEKEPLLSKDTKLIQKTPNSKPLPKWKVVKRPVDSTADVESKLGKDSPRTTEPFLPKENESGVAKKSLEDSTAEERKQPKTPTASKEGMLKTQPSMPLTDIGGNKRPEIVPDSTKLNEKSAPKWKIDKSSDLTKKGAAKEKLQIENQSLTNVEKHIKPKDDIPEDDFWASITSPDQQNSEDTTRGAISDAPVKHSSNLSSITEPVNNSLEARPQSDMRTDKRIVTKKSNILTTSGQEGKSCLSPVVTLDDKKPPSLPEKSAEKVPTLQKVENKKIVLKSKEIKEMKEEEFKTLKIEKPTAVSRILEEDDVLDLSKGTSAESKITEVTSLGEVKQTITADETKDEKSAGKTDKSSPPKSAANNPDKPIPKWKLGKTAEVHKKPLIKVKVGTDTEKSKLAAADKIKSSNMHEEEESKKTSDTSASSISDDDFWGTITGSATVEQEGKETISPVSCSAPATPSETKEEKSPAQEPQKIIEKRVPKLKIGEALDKPRTPLSKEKASESSGIVCMTPHSTTEDKTMSNERTPAYSNDKRSAVVKETSRDKIIIDTPLSPLTQPLSEIALSQTSDERSTEAQTQKRVPKWKVGETSELTVQGNKSNLASQVNSKTFDIINAAAIPGKSLDNERNQVSSSNTVSRESDKPSDDDFWGQITGDTITNTTSITSVDSPKISSGSATKQNDTKDLVTSKQEEKRGPKWKMPTEGNKENKTVQSKSDPLVDSKILTKGGVKSKDNEVKPKPKLVKMKKPIQNFENEENLDKCTSLPSSPVAKSPVTPQVLENKVMRIPIKEETSDRGTINSTDKTSVTEKLPGRIETPSPISPEPKPVNPEDKPVLSLKSGKPIGEPKKPNDVPKKVVLKGKIPKEERDSKPPSPNETDAKVISIKKSETTTAENSAQKPNQKEVSSTAQDIYKGKGATEPTKEELIPVSQKTPSTPVTDQPDKVKPVPEERAPKWKAVNTPKSGVNEQVKDGKQGQNKKEEMNTGPQKKVAVNKKPKSEDQPKNIPAKVPVGKKVDAVNDLEPLIKQDEVSPAASATVPEPGLSEEKRIPETPKIVPKMAEDPSSNLQDKDKKDRPKPKVVKVKKVVKVAKAPDSQTDLKQTPTPEEATSRQEEILSKKIPSPKGKEKSSGISGGKGGDGKTQVPKISELKTEDNDSQPEEKAVSLSEPVDEKKEEESDEDEPTSSSTSSQSGSTSSDDSGFDSLPTSVPVPSSSSSEGREPASPAPSLASNPSLDPYDDGSTETSRPGWHTPPAITLPRFRKYTVEDFLFLKMLGKGSFGKVLLAELKGTDRYYAVKCLKKDVVLEDDDVECTLIERKVLALGTKHPYLCHLFCTFQTESHLLFVMEYLNGGDLMFHIQQSGRFPEPRARFYAAEIVCGLKFLHKKGIVYRDLKLDNILLDYEGHVRIADFGMCKLQIFLERTADTFCGTPDYMAPEIIKGLKYNQCVDWWSFGVLLFEMLVGVSPFNGCDEDDLFWSICNEQPHYPRFLTYEANSILTKLLEKDASKRLGTPQNNTGDVTDHAFFRNIDWVALEHRDLDPPFKPRVKHPLDVQYFDKAFTAEKAILTPIDKSILQSMDQTQFQGFSYTNPNATD